ncbi:MAG: hypothetical protein PVH19_10235 [Planctomycetia bacterium]
MRRIGRKPYLMLFLSVGMLSLTLLAAGCTPFRKPVPNLLPLKPARMTSDSVVLDMFFVRFPLGDEGINGPFWDEIDEQKIEPEMRQLLAENGFRSGVISGPLPVRLSQLLQLKGKKQITELQKHTATLEEMEQAPTVTRRHLQLRSGRRGEITAQDALAELPVLLRDSNGKTSGETLYNAQPMFAVHTKNLPDGRVRVRLTPEIQLAQMRRGFSKGRNGMVKLDFGKERKSYENLDITTELGLGDFLVLSTIPVREGSLGTYFFTETTPTGDSTQKLLIIRLSQTQHDDQFE